MKLFDPDSVDYDVHAMTEFVEKQKHKEDLLPYAMKYDNLEAYIVNGLYLPTYSALYGRDYSIIKAFEYAAPKILEYILNTDSKKQYTLDNIKRQYPDVSNDRVKKCFYLILPRICVENGEITPDNILKNILKTRDVDLWRLAKKCLQMSQWDFIHGALCANFVELLTFDEKLGVEHVYYALVHDCTANVDTLYKFLELYTTPELETILVNFRYPVRAPLDLLAIIIDYIASRKSRGTHTKVASRDSSFD